MAAPGEPVVKAETPAAPRKQRIVFAQSRAAEQQERQRHIAAGRSDVVGFKRMLLSAAIAAGAIAAALLAVPSLCPAGSENGAGPRGTMCGMYRALPSFASLCPRGLDRGKGLRAQACTLMRSIRSPCPEGIEPSTLRGRFCALLRTVSPPPEAAKSAAPSSASASYAGKLKMHAAGFCVRKDSSKSAHTCGEDAYSVALAQGAPARGRSFIAVADGVGGWSESGGDSSKISIGILSRMAAIVRDAAPEDAAAMEAQDLVRMGAEAFAAMRRDGGFARGSTTVCAAALDHASGVLHVANVGDSGLVVLRDGAVLHRTRAGLDGFNTPHQVGFDDAGNGYGSFVSMATRAAVTLRPGDVVVAVSDGVLDNLYEDELQRLVAAVLGPVADARALADGSALRRVVRPGTRDAALEERLATAATALAMAAYARAKEMLWRSPFADAAMAHGYFYSGGKQDDISVVMALVTEA